MALTPFPCDSSLERTHLSTEQSDKVALPDLLTSAL